MVDASFHIRGGPHKSAWGHGSEWFNGPRDNGGWENNDNRRESYRDQVIKVKSVHTSVCPSAFLVCPPSESRPLKPIHPQMPADRTKPPAPATTSGFSRASTLLSDLDRRAAKIRVPEATADESDSEEKIAKEEEKDRVALNAWVCEARAAAMAEPSNAAKTLAYRRLGVEYDDGDFVADADILRFITRKTRQEFELDELRARAVHACPFKEAGHIDVYFKAARKFALDFGESVKFEDGQDDSLSKKRNLRRIQQNFLRLAPSVQAQLAGRERYCVEIVNPFPSHDDRRAIFDLEVRERIAFHKGVPVESLDWSMDLEGVRVWTRNKFHADPWSTECQEVYCTHELWAAGMKLFEEKAIAQVREKVVPAVVSPGNFYGAVDTALYR
ncbi:hypothetical protein K438DRAFT_1792019 [Mycena galopus ATCC 62051]|nr:hypothetical protein K438DRAFT_1792019 [Mycena galopus ATCC 62051]